MAEAWVATFKNELVDGRRFPSFEHAEHEVLEWIGFYNDERLHEALGDVPPAEYEEMNIKTDNTPTVAAMRRRGRLAFRPEEARATGRPRRSHPSATRTGLRGPEEAK